MQARIRPGPNLGVKRNKKNRGGEVTDPLRFVGCEKRGVRKKG